MATEASAIPQGNLPWQREGRAPWRVREITRAVSKSFDVPMRDLLGPKRGVEVVKARHAAMWIARREGVWSLPHIGRMLGNRDHTTILYGIKKAEQLFSECQFFAMMACDAIEILQRGDIRKADQKANEEIITLPTGAKVEPEQLAPKEQPPPARLTGLDVEAVFKSRMPEQFSDAWFAWNDARFRAGLQIAADCYTRKIIQSTHDGAQEPLQAAE